MCWSLFAYDAISLYLLTISSSGSRICSRRPRWYARWVDEDDAARAESLLRRISALLDSPFKRPVNEHSPSRTFAPSRLVPPTREDIHCGTFCPLVMVGFRAIELVLRVTVRVIVVRGLHVSRVRVSRVVSVLDSGAEGPWFKS